MKSSLGNIKIIATESVESIGTAKIDGARDRGFLRATGITSYASGSKKAGNIEIQTPKFFLQDGASISAGTDGKEEGGSISITGLGGKKAELVELSGDSSIGKALGLDNSSDFHNMSIGNGSRIRSITSSDARAGNVLIKAERLVLQKGTRIDVGSVNLTNSSRGNGGLIDIQANTLELSNGGQLISTTSGEGQAGNIQIAANSIYLTGIDESFSTRKAFFNFINGVNLAGGNNLMPVNRNALENYLQDRNSTNKANLLSLLDLSEEDSLIINKYLDFLSKSENSRELLRNYLPNRNALEPNPLDAFLLLNSDKKSGVVSRVLSKASGNGGDININANQLLQLRNQAQILATATGGRGGNITIQIPKGSVTAVPTENSDISASATNGRGGRVAINALNVVGFSTRASDRFSDITADGGTPGIVTINSNDPNRGLQPKPIEPGAPNITQDCRAINNTQISKLASSGKGGIDPNPSELIPTNNIWTDKAGITNTDKPTLTITAAKGWIAGQDRTVILTSQPNSYQSISSNSTNRNCYAK